MSCLAASVGFVAPHKLAHVPLNVTAASVCATASDICACADLAPGCGWSSSRSTCEPGDRATTTCRECPSTHKTCRKSCRRQCVDTCSMVSTVCGCSELAGCGFCSHGAPGQKCLPYPECSTTCEECDPSCSNYKHCKASCFARFRPTPAGPRQLWPLQQRDIRCALAIFLATVLASAAGIGGGAVLVPLFTLLGQFTEHEAIPLSLATVFGASTTSTLATYMWLKHPLVPHRHQIAYDVALMLMPATLLGATAGVFLNKLCPNWLIMLLLVLLCGYSGKRMLAKGFSTWAKESRERGGGEYVSVAQKEGDGGVELAKITPADDAAADDGTRDLAALEAERAKEAGVPWTALGMLLRTWVAVIALSALKGGHGTPSLLGVSCGTKGYWALVLCNIPVMGALTRLAARYLLGEGRRKAQIGYEYAEGDVEWDSTKTSRYPALVSVAAVAAGMLGVGGGMVLGPIFLELGMNAQVSSATSTLMVLFMSSANVAQFMVFGMLDAQYATFYGCVGVVGALVGTKSAGALLKATGRTSIIVFFLASILLGSGVLMVATGVIQLQKVGITSFRPICGRAGAAARVD